MSLISGSGTPGSPKRAFGGDTSSDPDMKKIKLEPNDELSTEPNDDPHFGGLFDPLPFETDNGDNGGFPLDNGDGDMPNFLDGGMGGLRPAPSNSLMSGGLPVTTNSMPGVPTASTLRLNPGLYRSNTLGDKTYSSPGPAAPMYPGQSTAPLPNVGYQSTYNQYRNNQYKPGQRFDAKKYPGMSVPMATNSYTSTAQDKARDDPSKLNDAIAAAGVDIQREEELLSTQYNRTALNLQQQQLANRQRQTYGLLHAFLHPYHVALFMNRAARENGVVQNFMMDTEMLEFMSAACKEWLSGIVTKTTTLARHRRRGIPALNGKVPTGKQKTIPPSQKSEVSKELRNLALRQKELEERRVAKRMALGLEKSDSVAPETGNKAGAEETLHRAANATAAMMTLNPSRKKYSWMTAGSGGAADDTKASASKDGGGKQSSLLSARGDNGLRFREIRTGNMVTTKDLLGVLEDERMGTSKAVVKGYAKLKD